MRPRDDKAEQDRMAANLRRGIELTELALVLRLGAMRQRQPSLHDG